MNCKNCKRRKHRIACLKCEQEAERAHWVVKPEIIKPLVKNVPLEDLGDRQKAMLILSIIGEMSHRRIAHLFGISHHTVKSAVAESLRKIRSRKKP